MVEERESKASADRTVNALAHLRLFIRSFTVIHTVILVIRLLFDCLSFERSMVLENFSPESLVLIIIRIKPWFDCIQWVHAFSSLPRIAKCIAP